MDWITVFWSAAGGGCLTLALVWLGLWWSRRRSGNANLSNELQASEKRLSLAAAAGRLALWEWDMDSNRLWMSSEGRWLYGLETSEALSFQQFAATLHPDDRPAMKQAIHAAVHGPEPYSAEYRVLLPDGSVRWIAAVGQIEQGARLLRGVSLDVTERKLAEEEMKRSKEFRKAVLDSMAAHIAVLDQDGVIVAVNARWKEFAQEHALENNSPDDFGIGVNYLEVCRRSLGKDSESAMTAYNGIQAVLAGKSESFSMEYPCELPQKIHWFSLIATRMGSDGKSVVISHLDITERKQAEERFRRVVEAAPNAMVMVDSRGRIALVNKQAESVFGYTREELIGAPIETLIPSRLGGHHAEVREGYQADPTARVMGAGRDLFGQRKDGSEVAVEIGLNPIDMPEGQYVLASIIDITSRRQGELESARQQQELAHLSRISILGELAGTLAHELNQPLAAILGNAQVGSAGLRAGQADLVELAAILDDIADDAKRAGGIIHGMRAMFLKDASTEPQRLDLNEIVTQVLRLLHSEIVSRRVKLQVDLAPDLPPANAVRVEIQQILINLVINALDAMKGTPNGNRLEITTALLKAGRVQITVRDGGPGIAPDMVERIFEPFVSTKQSGLGLGLAISRNIAQRFRGDLRAENHPEGGAIFHLVLPTSGDRDISCQ
jgi:PAS domain S-box-containing protein